MHPCSWQGQLQPEVVSVLLCPMSRPVYSALKCSASVWALFPLLKQETLEHGDHAGPWVPNLHRPSYHALCRGDTLFISVVWIKVWVNGTLTPPPFFSSLFLAFSFPQDVCPWKALTNSSLICWQGLEMLFLHGCLRFKRLLEDRTF